MKQIVIKALAGVAMVGALAMGGLTPHLGDVNSGGNWPGPIHEQIPVPD